MKNFGGAIVIQGKDILAQIILAQLTTSFGKLVPSVSPDGHFQAASTRSPF